MNAPSDPDLDMAAEYDFSNGRRGVHYDAAKRGMRVSIVSDEEDARRRSPARPEESPAPVLDAGDQLDAANRYSWRELSRLSLGRYAEYHVKMALTLAGLDVYTPEIDDRGLDFIVRAGPGRFYEFQVKSARRGSSYIFMRKSHFQPAPNLHLALVLFDEGHPPSLYLVPSNVWLQPEPPFVSRDYEGLKSPPEWGLNLTVAGRAALESYRFENVIKRL